MLSIWRTVLGLSLLLCVVMLWVLISFLSSTMLAESTTSKPFFLTYIMSIFLVIPYGANRLLLHGVDTFRDIMDISRVRIEISATTCPPENLHSIIHERSTLLECDVQVNNVLAFTESAKAAVQLCPLWLSANLFAMYCLRYTTVSSAIIITSTSTVWTLVIGTIMDAQRVTFWNLSGVLITLLGVSVIARLDGSISEGDQKQRRWLGDTLALICAISYSLYAIMLKKHISTRHRVDMIELLGLVGFFTAILFWPLFFILDRAGIEEFGLPPSREMIMSIFMISVLSMASDLGAGYAIGMLDPLLVTAALRLTIPLSLLIDSAFKDHYISHLYWFGASSVVGGVILVGYNDVKSQNDTEEGSRR